jgi:thiamine biosynthesis lipoprotein
VLEIQTMAMATSGNYRNYFVMGDSILGHTLDPRKGYPAMNELRSVTVLHEQCAIADAYATAFMVMGLDSAKAIVEADSTLHAYFIYEKDNELLDLMVD